LRCTFDRIRDHPPFHFAQQADRGQLLKRQFAPTIAGLESIV
jgi:hypothetical protein